MNSITNARAVRANGWVVDRPRRTPPAHRLFCLPWAGGNSTAYTSWQDAFGGTVEVCPIELPGRRRRWAQDPFDRLDPLVNALATAVSGELGGRWSLFGHSMGALVAFELARTLRRRGEGRPETLFVSAGPAPQLPRPQPWVHDQPDSVVVARLRALGGLPAELDTAPELMELLLPAIRADFAVCETYAHRPESPLDCPIVAFSGAGDAEVPPERVEQWRSQTTAGFDHHVLPGGHFMINTERDGVLAVVRERLAAG
ncbi:alpha/beta fold hydrolase [Actinoplanes sp. NPDC051851]|uniref:thioesterase II family protein n=1 Tax=Actinoplanes sp. NPDC051851 TaxID=3154753 RepID=UPI00342C4117